MLKPKDSEIEQMLSAYIATALWSSNDDDGKPLDDTKTHFDLSEECLTKFREDCTKFATENYETITNCFDNDNCCWGQAGHDFWLTRNGHGAGFWDGDWPKEQGQLLTEKSENFGEVDIYIGDDGKIYV
jgi:hypothetical protein